jgi:hypothetical protein
VNALALRGLRSVALRWFEGCGTRRDWSSAAAPVSGYVLSCTGSPTLYVAGDMVCCQEVAEAIQSHKPDIILVNSGAAQFLEGGPIAMDADDVFSVCQAAPKARVVALHMEVIYHCILTRAALQNALKMAFPPVVISQDGQELQFS